jgi:nucleoside-diphosphate-sugar epimerase
VFGPGAVFRDFIHVDDVVNTCLYFALEQGVGKSGVYNVGTGTAASFNRVAELVAKSYTDLTGYSCDVVAGTSPITSSPNYQNFTKADTKRLRSAGVNSALFKTIDTGVTDYCQWLRANEWKHSYDL